MTRRLLITLLAVVILVMLFWLGWVFLFDEEAAKAPVVPDASVAQVAEVVDAAPTPEPEAVVVRVADAVGIVEVLQPDESWKVLATGDELALGDRIRTGAGSKAVIDLAGTNLEIGENGSITVSELLRVDLEGGQVTAKVMESDEKFVVGAGEDTQASTSGGEFAVLSDGKGAVAVASKQGSTTFKKAGKSVEVAEGKVSRATATSGPGTPEDIPKSLFLKVKQPGTTIKKRRFTVRGESSPGTVIRVNGEFVKVGDDGTFQHVLVLSEGKNSLVVDSRDVLGRKMSRAVEVKVDSKAPAIDGKLTW